MKEIIIIPHIGIGQLKLGMTSDELENALLQMKKQWSNSSDEAMQMERCAETGDPNLITGRYMDNDSFFLVQYRNGKATEIGIQRELSKVASIKLFGLDMLTGDDERIGKSVADELGLDAYYAQLLPDQKVEKLEMLDKQKRQGSKLAFVGDGINDAPVLARADVGIAMGGLGSDAAIEAADVVLMTDEPSKLVEAIDVAKATKRIVMQNIVIALGIKSVFLVLGALGMAGMWEAVFGDVGVTIIAVLNAMRILKK